MEGVDSFAEVKSCNINHDARITIALFNTSLLGGSYDILLNGPGVEVLIGVTGDKPTFRHRSVSRRDQMLNRDASQQNRVYTRTWVKELRTIVCI
jgi:hypothetical protein